ncbi:class I adenylate-forming enzyme family protein [Virgibacillus sediminis]|uniref:Class I adenylate-forming enzyme family protein n=1 Tax=Virgibacillus sediminis TaxID=202260 RepID=A0ABV7A2U6_9BACI
MKLVDTQVRVVGKDGKDVTPNGKEVGEIIVKGNGVTPISEAGQELPDGWLRTGDMGTIDEEGRIHVVERNRDTIHDGEELSPLEIERVLYQHPEVEEVAVLVLPDAELGEVTHAFVVPYEDSQLTEQQLIDYAAERLDPPACPKQFTFMEELPKTASGKILKIQLRDII